MTSRTPAQFTATAENRIVPTIALVYDRDCPNVSDCRNALSSPLIELGAQPLWSEWDRNCVDTPAAYRGFGSPTVLVNGCDIYALDQISEADGNSCRVYADDARGGRGGLSGSPSVASIVNALERALVAVATNGTAVQGATPNMTATPFRDS